jgi:uncharacterized membrane protein
MGGRRVQSALTDPARVYAALLTVAAFACYAAISLQRQSFHYEGFDLAIFDQAVRHLAHFQAPISHIKGANFNLFGNHFHPIIVLAVPFYWAYPHAQSLLVAQAAAVALSVWIITSFAQRRIGPRLGTAIGIAYALSWGLQSALAFDFHEVSFGVPIIAAAGSAYLERRWRTAYVCTALLLLVKEDMALTVAALGLYVCVQRRVRAGLLIVASAAAWFALVMWVFIPALNPAGRYSYWSTVQSEPSSLLLNATQWHTLLLVLLPTLFLALLSPLSVALLPTIAWRFWSDNPSYWGTHFHYSEILMPVVFLAGVDGAIRLSRWSRNTLDPAWTLRLVSAGVLVVALGLLPRFSFWQATHGAFWQSCPRCAAANDVVKQVPNHARVAVDTLLMPELVDRADVYPLRPDLRYANGQSYEVDYVVLDVRHQTLWPQPDWMTTLKTELVRRAFVATLDRDGYVLYTGPRARLSMALSSRRMRTAWPLLEMTRVRYAAPITPGNAACVVARHSQLPSLVSLSSNVSV